MTQLRQLLSPIPPGLLDPLMGEFDAVLSAYRTRDWEKVGLKAGKVAEVVYTILVGLVSGSYAPAPWKPANMLQACQDLEKADKTRFSRSVRVLLPRVLISIYEFRNNRSIGHVGGEVNPNHMDAEFLFKATKWTLAELVRIFSYSSLTLANAAVESLSSKDMPLMWSSGPIRRVLDPGLKADQKTLIFLYDEADWVPAQTLCDWVEYKNPSRFRSQLLGKLQKQKKIEFDRQADHVTLLPPGIRDVEALLRVTR